MDIKIDHISKVYKDKTVFADFSARIESGKCNCLMAPSGTGKTTLLRMLMGLEKPDKGEIMVVAKKEAQEGERMLDELRVGVVFQEDRLCEKFSAIENVRLVQTVAGKTAGGKTAGGKTAEFKTAGGSKNAVELLEKLGLSAVDKKPVAEYSGGMRRRVAIARALAVEADLYLFDEPFTGMDEATKQQVMETMGQELFGKTWVLVTHDRKEIGFFGGKEMNLH